MKIVEGLRVLRCISILLSPCSFGFEVVCCLWLDGLGAVILTLRKLL